MTFREFDLWITRELKWFGGTLCLVTVAVFALRFLTSTSPAGPYMGEGLSNTSNRILDELAHILEQV